MQAVKDLPVPAKSIDWQLVQTLYVSGLGPKAIEAKLGVKADAVSVRASRGNWRNLAQAASDHLKAGVIAKAETVSVSSDTSGISHSSAKARSSLASEVLAAVSTLSDTPRSKSLQRQARRASVLQTLAGAAKTVFAWQDGAQPAVRISILASAVRVDAPAPPPAIDVEASFSSPSPAGNEGEQPL